MQVMHRVGVQIILLLPMNLCLPHACLMVALILLKKAKEFTQLLHIECETHANKFKPGSHAETKNLSLI